MRMYHNPIICADYSDPDVVRVGNDFFMVASSFNHMPGLPLLHSTDLVNWTIINHVLQTLPLPGYEEVQPGKGAWAPSIRWHDEKLWVFFSTPDEGIFMSWTQDPWGEWQPPHCVKAAKGWIDPCPFWDDDGKAWLVHAFAHSRSGIKHKLQLLPMTPDGKSVTGEGQILYDGTCDLPTLEGPKVYKRNDWYYIFAPAGGVESGWQTVLRARDMQGPWQTRNVLFQGDTPVNGPHQGGWVEGEQGECWFVHFQDAHIYGRIVHLQPMFWGDDDWPRIGEQIGETGVGQPVSQCPSPSGLLAAEHGGPQTSDDFHHGVPGLQWQWQANPQPQWRKAGSGGLHLTFQPVRREALYWSPNLLLQKFPARTFSAQTALQLDTARSGDAGGLIVYGERYAALLLEHGDNACRLLWVCGWMSDSGQVREETECITPLAGSQCQLRVEVGAGGICRFSWRSDGEEWQSWPRTFAAGKGKWVGAKLGLAALNLHGQASEGNCLFSSFTVNVP
ncbi:glycosyl hydrolase 43 family protein [Citrobacter sp. RHBSTW-00229]|uniref:glycoside hydrolase family 43 protein n=2 Tax=Citrobacter TaxID=544 RepID=UPI000CDE519C|nr:glycoside hydrolase [Citrobacter braakii]QLO84729.1 glycosyl hydrolase 43 family protein [Citrobacter sp. RHBSTW-00944]QLX39822.1 glycosyl hydrolase 43 family protein [Citrobacter sp. RHBSTW-00229]POT36652.1 glycoside hydrolase [Citrobacter braakii]POT42667.1 glycoside hydrolase [Citrobacter braakii]